MRNLLTTTYLTLFLSLGTIGAAWGADYFKGLDAYASGDYATALREWGSLARQGKANAQRNLGLMYLDGEGVPLDYKMAVKWFRLAAEQGNADAQNNLA